MRLRHLAGMGISVSELLMRPEPDASCSAIEEEEGEEEEEADEGGSGDYYYYYLFDLRIYISLLTRSSSDIPNMANRFSSLNNEVSFLLWQNE